MSRHRAQVRPRYGRLAVLGSAVAITAIAVLGSVGVLPDSSPAAQPTGDHGSAAIGDAAAQTTPSPSADPSTDAPAGAAASRAPAAQRSSSDASSDASSTKASSDTASAPDPTALPAGSGEGRRIVFSQSRQRVWLVGDGDRVARTYAVSGSVTDNLEPGTYSVYSRSRWAVGVDDSGVMQYFVRFTKGPNGAAIGFHTIPTKLGRPLQTLAQLGTPRSHGCIRQKDSDAIALWGFAPVGTTVVVTA